MENIEDFVEDSDDSVLDANYEPDTDCESDR